MHPRLRLWGTATAIALLISALAPFRFGVSQGAQPSTLSPPSRAGPVIASPPPGLGLPAGQYVGVRYRFAGAEPAILELASDDVVLIRDRVQPGQAVTHAWTPASPGPHQLRVRALALDGRALGSVSLTVIALPAGSRTQLPPGCCRER